MAGIIAKGDVELLVDGLGIEAILKFTPNEEGGAEWTAESLQKVVAEARLSGLPPRRIDEILFIFSKAHASVSEVIVRGQLPLPGAPEEAEWMDFATPEQYLPFESRAIATAQTPELFTVRIEKVARERQVKKPGAFSFLSSRVETVVEYEKVESRQPVSVDTKVLRSFWAPAGTVIARLFPPRIGKPGKDIFGKIIPADRDEDVSFHLGRGLSRGKNEIVCDLSGFIRVGSRWADVVPFAGHRVSLSIGEDNAAILLDFIPGDKRLSVPDARDLLEEARIKGGAADCMIGHDELGVLLGKAVRNGEPLKGYSLSCSHDAGVSLETSSDRLRASLTIMKGRGNGKSLELSMVSAALAGQHFKGVKIDKLKADVIAFYKSQELELRDYLLVEGRAPGRGKDRTLLYGVAFLPDAQSAEYLSAVQNVASLSNFVKNTENFPLASAKRVALVKSGQEICRFSPPSPGQSGVDVYGVTLPGLPGNDPIIRIFENLKVLQESIESEEDGLLLLSESSSGTDDKTGDNDKPAVDDVKMGEKKADKVVETLMRVIPYRDAVVDIHVDEDARTVRIDLEKEYGLGKDLSLDMVQQALSDSGIVHGIDVAEIAAALGMAREQGKVGGHVVARAKEPVPAGGYRLLWMIRIASGAALTLRSDGSADFKNQDKATIVAEGQPVLELQSIGSEGQDGMDVYGKPIKAPVDPRVVQPPTWDETIREEKKENGDRILYAVRNGELSFENNKLSVSLSQKIKGDVGPATGNIRFPGSITIGGAVLSGYTVISGGDILVGGAVEAALVSADGMIRIVEGIKGAKRGTVRARKTVEASFAEQAIVLAVDDIVFKSSALLCNVKTNGKLVLQGERGALIGGLCRVRKGAEIQTLGSENGARTQISFGQDYLIMDAIEAEEREIEKVKAMILQADRNMRQLESDGANLDKIRQDKL
ncbi:MAG: flagellar assembly protein A, partial [Spirochaetota bacterium]